MRSTFFGIELTRRALWSQQRAMDVASHNIANANDPAYSRQRAEIVATAPLSPPVTKGAGVAGQIGTGVWVRAIERLRDAFMDERIRDQNTLLGGWGVRRDVLEQIERLLNEPSDNGIRKALDRFWESLQELSGTPESEAVREVVVQRGQVLAQAVQSVFRQLEALRADLDRTVELKVERINALSQRLAELNRQIGEIAASGQSPNDLLDERDAVLEEVSSILPVEVTVRPPEEGSVRGEQVAVSVGGLSLVDGDSWHRLVMDPVDPTRPSSRSIHWESPTGPVVRLDGPAAGEIGAHLALRGEVGAGGPAGATGEIPEIMAQLDDWVRALVTAFNAQHQTGLGLDGVGGRAFFAGDDADLTQGDAADSDGDGWVADDMRVLDPILGHPEWVAAAGSANASGDNVNALALAGLLKVTAYDGAQPGGVDLGGVTLPDFLGSIAGRIGVDTQEAQMLAANQELLTQHLRSVRESISGVSLDEEMADLLRFEHAYGAAARAMTAMDSVLDTLINKTGLVGR